MLQKVKAAKPDVFIAAQFAADSVALLKQVSQMGLGKEMTIFNAFITNVVAKGLPPEALQGVYAMHYFYYDLSGFEDKAVAKSAAEFTALFQAKYNYPPDAYATIAYVAYMEMFRGFEAAKSFDAESGVGRADGQWRQVRHRQGAGELARGSFGRLQIRRLPGEGQRPRRAEEPVGSVHGDGRRGRRRGAAEAQGHSATERNLGRRPFALARLNDLTNAPARVSDMRRGYTVRRIAP